MAFTAVFALTVLGGIISEYVLKRNRDSEIAAATTIQRHARGMISRKRPIRAAEDMHCFYLLCRIFVCIFVCFLLSLLHLYRRRFHHASPRPYRRRSHHVLCNPVLGESAALTPSELPFLVLVCLNIQRW